MNLGSRIAARRVELGLSQADLAAAVGMRQQGIASIEAGIVERPRKLREIAKALRTTEEVLLGEAAAPNASHPIASPMLATVPAYGQAIGGDDGYFVLNGQKIADLLAPASLMGVRDAYAVLVSGESMEPRYEAGEAVFVNPHVPVRRGHYVVAQIRVPGDEMPRGYVKRFVRMSDERLILEQLNPAKELAFPRRQVVSVHRIVASGEG